MSKTALAGTSLVAKPRTGRAQASRTVTQAASARPVWFPGNKRPEHLDGDFADLPGNFGFDPLSLGSDADTLKWFQQAELVHCRWAMLGVAGILFPEIATMTGTLNAPNWVDAGKVWANQHPEVPQPALLFTELLLMGWVETKRWQDFRNPGSQGDGSFLGITDGFKGKGNGYPGGLFDPLGLSKGTDEQLRKYQENEVKNGRLAMVALVGFVAQHAAYPGTGPVQNLVDHIADPYKVTFATNGVSLPFLNPDW